MGFLDTVTSPFKMVDSFLNPQRGYEAGEDALGKGWDEAKSYQLPFQGLGLQQYPQIQAAIQKLLNPGALENEWASSYEASPFAKRDLEMNREQGLDAASSMGLMGSSGAINNIQRGAGDIVSKDRTQFMQDLMQKFLSGLGLSHDIFNTGASAGTNLGNQALGMGENMAGLEYGKQNSPGNLLENLIKTGASAWAAK